MLSVFLTFTVFLTIKVLFFCCLLELLDLYYIYLLSSYLFLRYLRCGSSEIQVSPTPVCPINIGWIFYLISIQRVWTATRLPFPVLVRICYRILPLYWILPTEIDSKIYFSFNIGGNNCKGKKKKKIITEPILKYSLILWSVSAIVLWTDMIFFLDHVSDLPV